MAGHVNGCAVLRFAPALRVTHQACYGSEAGYVGGQDCPPTWA